ncbi:MAG: hypothetical protein H0T45_12160 [Pyrinomonadaceae bacterium]|nr:hypothetical protein [Pyrinomonadaceae bacterium]
MNKRELSLVFIVIVSLGAAVALARWMEARPSQFDEARQREVEKLYLTPAAARRMSLGFNGLVADWYWVRSLQYVGRRLLAYRGPLQLDDLSPAGLELLAPLLDTATTIDPQFLAPYHFGAVVLPAVDQEAAIRLLTKGIAANPAGWRLYSDLGFIYWQQGRYAEAAPVYRAGSQIAGAPGWVALLAGLMSAQGGSRETAREIYRRLHESTTDPQMKELAVKRLLQLESWDQRDVLRRVLRDYQTNTGGRCPAAWRDVAMQLRRVRAPLGPNGAPLDPTGAPYQLVPAACDVELDEKSEIIR